MKTVVYFTDFAFINGKAYAGSTEVFVQTVEIGVHEVFLN